MTAFDSFISRTKKTRSCWLWTGPRDFNGYGDAYISKDKKKTLTMKAHRLSYIFFVGEISKGKVIMHVCDNRQCVNPAHLREGSTRDNVLDCVTKGRHRNQNTGRAICKNGHKLSGTNVRLELGRFRRCMICKKEYQRRYDREQRNKQA